MYVYQVHAVPTEAGDGITSPGNGVTDGYKAPCGTQSLESRARSLQKSPVPMTAKSDLQPLPSLWRQGRLCSTRWPGTCHVCWLRLA